MTWLMYGAVAFIVYKLATNGKLSLTQPAPAKPKKKKRAKKKIKRPGDGSSAPHEVLGVEPGASEAEVRQAYQELMRKYHPDRVANAADELRDLAEKRSKQINAAYEAMMRQAAN